MENFDLDELDIRLLKALQLDASLTNEALAKKMHTSSATCLRRISRLKSLGYIQKEVVILNANHFKESIKAIVEITLEKQTSDAITLLENALIKQSAVKQCYRVAANSDIVIILNVESMDEYHTLVNKLLSSQFNIRNVRALFITHQSKFDTSIPL
ncbi:Lrp/AsnC family transcriptional regulator [Thorsellia kenyensis]|uniref:Lrp/AsnC family transcriptional regulator n=1 Tax=Thorsellia kenyensis TaxID=1549888 RepID=A0ABV6CE33_9GAMM